MTGEARGGRGRRLLLALMVLIAAVMVPLTHAADAGVAAGPQRMSRTAEEGSAPPGGETDRWWGVAGAALCGFEIRLAIRVPAIGLNPYAIAAGIAGCGLAALDVFTTN